MNYEDSKHIEIRNKIKELEDKISSLEAHKEDWGLQHQALHKMVVGGASKETIEQQKQRADSTSRPEQIEVKINDIRRQIQEQWKVYYETEFILPPLKLSTCTTFEDKSQGIELRPLRDAKSADAPLYLFLNSQYPEKNVRILYGEDGKPNTIIRFIISSDTRGFVMKYVQPILLDQVPVPKEPIKNVTPKPVKPLEENLLKTDTVSTDKKPKRIE